MLTKTKTREKTNVVVRTRTDCRMCGGKHLTKVWSFGETPLANNYMTPEDVAAKKFEPFAPLDIYKCDDCHLVQIRDVVDPQVLFGKYLYVSSTSPAFVKHFEEYAKTLVERFHLTEKDWVVDVGSNDGVLLKPLQKLGVKTLGIEPATNIAQQANAEGVKTVAEFFTPHLASQLLEQYGKKARVIAANNVFAHTDGVDEFVEAVKRLLADDGIFVFEVQYLRDLIAKNLFDIVYHEHVCYYHVHPLVEFFRRHDMEVFDVERPSVHGGSLRVFVTPSGSLLLKRGRNKRVDQSLQEEENLGLNTLKPYKEFAARIKKNKQALQKLLQDLKAQGKRIVGYGAPAKATTLCYAFGIDGKDLDYIVDDSPMKQGRLMPGTHIPIVSAAALRGNEPHFAKATRGKPEYILILAWNFAEPIRQNNAWFAEKGGKWIIPTPEPRVVG